MAGNSKNGGKFEKWREIRKMAGNSKNGGKFEKWREFETFSFSLLWKNFAAQPSYDNTKGQGARAP